ncbi:MAG: prenyltransferase/squalene oxidase repeat-containing protein [Cellvibrio sp.]
MIDLTKPLVTVPTKMPWNVLRNTVDYILSVQQPDGAIPWFAGGKLDPWDHVEAIMGLTIGGEFQAAKKGFEWLFSHQLDDGSWYSHYQDNLPQDTHHRETHFVAYIAVGLFHYGLITNDWQYIGENYSKLQAAINFVLQYQTQHGEFHWAVDEKGIAQEDALITANSSIYKSLQTAIFIADTLGAEEPHWVGAYHAVGDALRNKPERFDRTWEPKTRFSMDWFYPILSGVLNNEEAKIQLQKRWNDFVHPPLGCRCVSDEPWVTVAESCELILALCAMSERTLAMQHFSNLFSLLDNDGGFWTGINYRDNAIWPEEKTTWTAGVALLAADAIFKFTDASELFCLEGGPYSILREKL